MNRLLSVTVIVLVLALASCKLESTPLKFVPGDSAIIKMTQREVLILERGSYFGGQAVYKVRLSDGSTKIYYEFELVDKF